MPAVERGMLQLRTRQLPLEPARKLPLGVQAARNGH